MGPTCHPHSCSSRRSSCGRSRGARALARIRHRETHPRWDMLSRARRAWTRHLGSSNHQGSPSREEAAEPHWQAAHDSELDEEERGQERQQRIEEEKQQGVVEEDHCEQTRTTIATAHASSRTYPNVMASGCTREGVAEEQCRSEGSCWLVVAAATAAGSMVMVGPGRANGGERGTWVGERRFG